MIHFNQIANPPQPAHQSICGNCEGRGVVPKTDFSCVEPCQKCKPVQFAVMAERNRILALLDGITECETDSDNGWWETSEGAAFGASVVQKIKEQLA